MSGGDRKHVLEQGRRTMGAARSEPSVECVSGAVNLLLSDTFTASLARLTGEEQKAVKTTAFDLQMYPATGAPGAPARWGGSPGMRFHRLDRAKDRNFWSVRVSGDIRLIVHRTDGSLLLCYVDHHDAAYAWAERRKLERHPTTGAAQLVEIRETVREIEVPVYVEAPATPVQAPPKPRLFEGRSGDELPAVRDASRASHRAGRCARVARSDDREYRVYLREERRRQTGCSARRMQAGWHHGPPSYGIPAEWLDDVRGADEDSILQVADHLPGEAAEALLELATGGTPKPRPQSPDLAIGQSSDGFSHPDAQRRFRLMATSDELQRALDAPWDAWTVFLHPDQQDVVSRRHGGPARVAGSAGTGKTIVALHSAVRLAREHPEEKVLLTTFSDTLARMLEQKLRRLAGPDEDVMRRVDVRAIDRVGLEVCESLEAGKGGGAKPIRLVDEARLRALIRERQTTRRPIGSRGHSWRRSGATSLTSGS